MDMEQMYLVKFNNNVINFLLEIDSIFLYLKMKNNTDFTMEDILYIVIYFKF